MCARVLVVFVYRRICLGVEWWRLSLSPFPVRAENGLLVFHLNCNLLLCALEFVPGRFVVLNVAPVGNEAVAKIRDGSCVLLSRRLFPSFSEEHPTRFEHLDTNSRCLLIHNSARGALKSREHVRLFSCVLIRVPLTKGTATLNRNQEPTMAVFATVECS